jgi:hypothetical protein
MKIKIPVIIKRLELGDYNAAYTGQFFEVWVNPSREMLIEREVARIEYSDAIEQMKKIEAEKEKLKGNDLDAAEKEIAQLLEKIKADNDLFNHWYSEIWSQGNDTETHITAEEVEEFSQSAAKNDPQLSEFVFAKTLELISEYRQQRKN